jgi:hypothetical protein
MFDLVHVQLAHDATRRHVLSARPDAPTIPERPPREIRRRTATVLRAVADRLEGAAPAAATMG